MLGREFQVRSADIGEEVDVAQAGGAGNPSGGFGPHAPKLGERYVLARDVAINNALGSLAPELHDHIADTLSELRIADEGTVERFLLRQPVIVAQRHHPLLLKKV